MKVAVVTGGTSGIGKAISTILQSNGYEVFSISLHKGTDKNCFICDVNDHVKMKEIIKEIVAKRGKIDVFVNNAGFGIGGEVANSKCEDLDRLLSTNLTAVAKNIAIVGKIMKEQKFGKIINISSLASIFPLPYQACYSASKAGVETLSRATRSELKPYNVYVTAILPGDVKTNFTDSRIKAEDVNLREQKSIMKMEKEERNGMSPDVIAKKVLKIANMKKPPIRVCVCNKLLIFLQKILPIKLIDWLILKIYC